MAQVSIHVGKDNGSHFHCDQVRTGGDGFMLSIHTWFNCSPDNPFDRSWLTIHASKLEDSRALVAALADSLPPEEA